MPLLTSLRGRLALVILFSSLLTVTTILLVAYQSLVRDLESFLSSQQTLETQQFARQIENELTLRLFALESLSRELTDGVSLLSQPALSRSLQDRAQLETLFPAAILILDKDANAVAESRYVPGRVGTNYADRPHFQRLLRSNQAVISQPILGRTTGAPLISFLDPILSDDQQLLGIVGGTIDLSKTSFLSEQSQGNLAASGFQILDSSNFYYVQSDANQAGLTITELPDPGVDPLIDRALQGISSGTVTMPDGTSLMYATAIVPTLNWVVLKANPVEEVLAPARASFIEFILISFGICILLALMGFMATQRSMRPLSLLTRRIQRMAKTPDSIDTLPNSGVSEVRELADAFNELTRERVRLNQLKEDFISTVSHELRTPLTAMHGSLKLVNSGVGGQLPDKARELTELAQRNADRLQSLIQDLLDFNKLQAGRMLFDLKSCELKPILQTSLDNNRMMANHYQVKFDLQCPGSTLVQADPGRLQQVIDNFLSNSIKHAPALSTITIMVEIHTKKVRIIISDTGSGVPENFRNQLFTRFAQAEVGSRRAIKGTGLGLAICKELAEHMMGEVGYYYKKGAHFWVEIPLSDNRELSQNPHP